MLAEVEREAGRRLHHARLVGFGIDRLTAPGICEAFVRQELVCLVEVVHVHADERHILWDGRDVRNVHGKSVCVLHPDAVKVRRAGVRLNVMLFGKAQLLKQSDDGLGILRNDQGIESCDFMVVPPEKMIL